MRKGFLPFIPIDYAKQKEFKYNALYKDLFTILI